MSWRYRCGACRTISTHDHQHQADSERYDHIATVHRGRIPEDDEVRPLTEEELAHSRPAWRPPYPADRPPQQQKPNQPFALALLVVLLLVGWGLYSLLPID
ncbi:hypothetical protein ACFC26_43200 [Kitasatospora purpeofusca]|uniref:hypothetical protein n=1 Tax=Kitasatospora purpeofusca TaxID=67352 RepID=UPI0035DDE361